MLVIRCDEKTMVTWLWVSQCHAWRCELHVSFASFCYRRNLELRVGFHMISAKSIRQEVFAELLTMFDGVEVTSFVNLRLSICSFLMQSVTEHRPQKPRAVHVYILSELV